jgi:hypothetical protein
MKQKNTKSNKIKIKVGIVGEHPQNDSEALRHLLAPKACTDVQFIVITKRLHGSDLDDELNGGASKKFLRLLEVEMENENLSHVIFVRDLDGVLSEKGKVQIRDRWFNQANKTVEGKGIFFLAIAEMEALILADIETFNRFYGLKVQFSSNPMTVTQPHPKERLKQYSAQVKQGKGKYEENHAPEIFKSLVFLTVYKNHKGERSFQTFADELKEKQIIAF